MSNNLLAFVTFGLTNFTRLLIKSIKDTTKSQYEIFAIVGKPNDEETKQLLTKENISFKSHNENMGFPASINDIYDYAWNENNFKNLILMGNDIIVYPNSVDNLINLANNSQYSVISALQYDVRDLVREYPETRKYFTGDNYIFKDFSSSPWDLFIKHDIIEKNEPIIAEMQLYDIQNLCLYKRQVFDTIGYTDVNFYPAYFVDNDYARRIVKAGLSCCSLLNARFFHFWSRVIKQGNGGSTPSYFENSKKYYRLKWGGNFGEETIIPEIKISDRTKELSTINYWKYM